MLTTEKIIEQRGLPGLGLKSEARFSPCNRYRYMLGRHWHHGEGVLMVIGLNPSTATELIDDPTIQRLMIRAEMLGFQSLVMLNLFAYRSTDPEALKRIADPVGPENDREILHYAGLASEIVAAWGNGGKLIGRSKQVVDLLTKRGYDLYAFKINEKTGEPAHPLYLSYELRPSLWRVGLRCTD